MNGDNGRRTSGDARVGTDSSKEVDDIYGRAIGHGAEIVLDLADSPFGSHQFAVRDLEDNVWTVGTYRPSAPSQA